MKTVFSCSLGTCHEPEDPLFKEKGFTACVCMKQTCLQSSRGRPLILTAGALIHSALFSSPRIKWLFVLPQRCLSLVSPRLPSPPHLFRNERIFWVIDLVFLPQIPQHFVFPPESGLCNPRFSANAKSISCQ